MTEGGAGLLGAVKIMLGRNIDSWGAIKKAGRRGSLMQDSGEGKVKLFLIG